MKEIALILVTALGLFGLVFGLAVALQPETAAEPMLEPATNRPADVATPASESQVTAGASLFARNCAHCHGDDAKGDEGPNLYDLTRSDARITRLIREGVKGEMPKFATKFTDAQIQSLIAFLHTLKSPPNP